MTAIFSACNPLVSKERIDDNFLAATSSSSTSSSASAAFSANWPFTAGTDASYSFSATEISLAGGVCRLTPADQTDDSAAELASASAAVGLTYSSGYKLGSGGGCDGSTTNCNELNSTWAPQWANLVGYWKLNEATGTTGAGSVADSSGNGRTGTPTTVGFGQTGHMGNAAFFDGVNSFVSVPDAAALRLPTAFTVSAWVNPTSVAAYQQIVSKFGASPDMSWQMNITNTGLLRFDVSSNGTTYTQLISATQILTNRWTHVVTTWDGATIKMYLNGNLDASNLAYAGPIFGSAATTVDIGRATGWNSQMFSGKIDEVAIWNTALTNAEVTRIYQTQLGTYGGAINSRVMDAYQAAMSWSTFFWSPTLPFGKELPDFNVTVQNETTSDYPNIYSNSLMTGIKALWHMNEGAWAGAAGEVKDTSGNGFDGTAVNGASTTANAMWRYAGNFDGVNDRVSTTGINLSTSGTPIWSASAWVYIKSCNNVAWPLFFTYGYWGITLGINSATCKLESWINNNGTELLVANTVVSQNTWHHVAIVVDGTNRTIYLDGVADGSRATGTINVDATGFSIGADVTSPAVSAFKGRIDDLAIWSRALDANEIKQLYQRGISRLKFQVRSCTDNTCTAGSPQWQGPDGTSGTFFSEYYNRVNQGVSPSGGVKPVAPTMTLSSYTTPPASNRYFQYRAIFDSDSSATADQPQVVSMGAGPIHYSTSNPTIYSNNGVSFSTLSSFTQTLGTSCASGIGYNLSIDKVNWYYWSGVAWVLANGTVAQSNTASVINTNISTFPAQVSTGSIYFKAFLKSTGTSSCELDDVTIQ